jgi:hypothetical protein
MKQYRLLRNNKESGPYSAEELIQSGFKPYDLIWADGKSAAWRYPGEMGEFKMHAPAVEEQPFDRFYKKPSPTESKKESPIPILKETITPVIKETPASIASSNFNAIPSIVVKAEKPRIRIKADSRKIEMPVVSEPVIQKEKIKPVPQEEKIKPALQKEIIKPMFERETVKTTQAITNPGWKDMWLDWEQEKKAISSLNKISVKDHAHEVLETKFSQSLDEIKERYVETVLKPKRISSIGKSGNLITVFILIAAILGFGMWMGIKWSGNGNTLTQQKIASIQPQSVKTSPENEQPHEQNLPAADETKTSAVNNGTKTSNNENKTSAPSNENSTNPVSQPVAHNTIPAIKKTQTSHSVDEFAESKSVYQPKQKKPVKDFTFQEESKDVEIYNKNVQQNDVAENNVRTEPKKQAPPSGFNHFKPQPKITDFISVDTYVPSPGSAVGVKLRVQNISGVAVDMVMVDLHYYDSNGRYQTGATVYVRNISAGQTVTVLAPDNSHAVKVNYRIAMISSEKDNMYLIAD